MELWAALPLLIVILLVLLEVPGAPPVAVEQEPEQPGVDEAEPEVDAAPPESADEPGRGDLEDPAPPGPLALDPAEPEDPDVPDPEDLDPAEPTSPEHEDELEIAPQAVASAEPEAVEDSEESVEAAESDAVGTPAVRVPLGVAPEASTDDSEAAPLDESTPQPASSSTPDDEARADRVRLALTRLAATERPPWTERRAKAWKLRRRWFTEPGYRNRLLERLAPGGGAAPSPPRGKVAALHAWLEFLGESTRWLDQAETAERVVSLYGPWRGFTIDLTRALRRRRAREGADFERNIPPPQWLAPLERLEAFVAAQAPYDFLEQPLDRALLERDGIPDPRRRDRATPAD